MAEIAEAPAVRMDAVLDILAERAGQVRRLEGALDDASARKWLNVISAGVDRLKPLTDPLTCNPYGWHATYRAELVSIAAYVLGAIEALDTEDGNTKSRGVGQTRLY